MWYHIDTMIDEPTTALGPVASRFQALTAHLDSGDEQRAIVYAAYLTARWQKNASKPEAAKIAGADRTAIWRWEQERPDVTRIGRLIALSLVDDHADQIAIVTWPQAIEQLARDAVNLDLDAVDRRASIKLLHQLQIQPSLELKERLERDAAKTEAEAALVKRRRMVSFVPHFHMLGAEATTGSTSHTRPPAPAIEEPALDGHWELVPDTDPVPDADKD